MPDHEVILNSSPTGFRELNALLIELTEMAVKILQDNFVGAYLQGSFALGDADVHSDCDFLVVVEQSITSTQEESLRTFHDEIPTRDGYWTHHLEGSYAPREDLRTIDRCDRDWLYLDHGWREMQWSPHCNTEVVRWTLRTCGVVLAGPSPRDLIDEVPPVALRRRMRVLAADYGAHVSTWFGFTNAWEQRYVVSTVARILFTLETATVGSKRAALVWGMHHLDPPWRPLFQQVLDDRSGWDPEERPRPGSVDRTLAFVGYAADFARNHSARPGVGPLTLGVIAPPLDLAPSKEFP